jgi:hypothetical protein
MTRPIIGAALALTGTLATVGVSGVRLVLSTARILTVGEPVVLDYRFENLSDQSVGILLAGYENDYFRLEVTRGSGQTVVRNPWDPGALRVPMYPLAPRQSVAKTLILNRWFDFSMTGDYRIGVRYSGRVQAGAGAWPTGAVITIDSPPELNLTILPRDENVLRRRCQELAGRIQQTTSLIVTRHRDAEVLSFVADPVAIPFLVQVAEGNVGEEYAAVEGLARIGGAGARQALTRLALSSKPEIAQAAKQALSMIRGD